jgi:hypothetical protein
MITLQQAIAELLTLRDDASSNAIVSETALTLVEALKTADGAKACTAYLWAEIGEPEHAAQAAPPAVTGGLSFKEEAERLTYANPAINHRELANFAEWALGQFQGDSGTGHSYWEQFPQYISGVRAVQIFRKNNA